MGDYLEAWKSRMLNVEVEVLLFQCWNSTNKGIFGMSCTMLKNAVLVLGCWMTMGDAKTVQSHYSKSGVF